MPAVPDSRGVVLSLFLYIGYSSLILLACYRWSHEWHLRLSPDCIVNAFHSSLKSSTCTQWVNDAAANVQYISIRQLSIVLRIAQRMAVRAPNDALVSRPFCHPHQQLNLRSLLLQQRQTTSRSFSMSWLGPFWLAHLCACVIRRLAKYKWRKGLKIELGLHRVAQL